jgi:hypothetical protein
MEKTGYDSSPNLSGEEEEVTKEQLVTKICETLDAMVEDLHQIQQDVALRSDSVSQAYKLSKLLEDDGDVFIIPTDDGLIGTTGDEWRIERTPVKERSDGPRNDDITLVEGTILGDSKPDTQPSKKDTRLAGQQRAREWATQQFKRQSIKTPRK